MAHFKDFYLLCIQDVPFRVLSINLKGTKFSIGCTNYGSVTSILEFNSFSTNSLTFTRS